MKNSTPKPPKHLSAEAGAWWLEVQTTFDLDSHHVRLLTLACQAWDRAEQARLALAKHGTTFEDRWKQPHARPEVAIERDSRIAFARLLRELGLDLAEEPARPPALKTHRG